MTEATFRASGISSGIDTAYLIEELTRLQRIPLDRLNDRKAAFTSQVSAIGNISSKLNELKTAANKLSTSGGLGVKVNGTTESFSVTPGTDAVAGRYEVQVNTLATNARGLSAAIATGATIKSGTLTLGIEGTNYDVTIDEGASLTDVANAIKASGAPVSAVVLNNGTDDFLSIVNKDSGYTIGGSAASALTISANQTGGSGTDLSFSITNPVNATFSVNGLDFTRRSNTVGDAVPGASLSLKTEGGAAESFLLENDTSATAANLKSFVDAYNGVMKVVSDNLKPAAATDRTFTLAGDGALRSLQRSLQGMLTSEVSGLSDVRTLADLGFETSQVDGTISIDETALGKALERDADAVNKIFSTATTGVSALMDDLSSRYTNSSDGILTSRKSGIDRQQRDLDTQIDAMGLRIEAYRTTLVNQFTAMERTLAALNATGSYLSRQYGG